MEELRSHPSYVALPATPPLLQPSTYRCVMVSRCRCALCAEQLVYGPTVIVRHKPSSLSDPLWSSQIRSAMLVCAALEYLLSCNALRRAQQQHIEQSICLLHT